LPSPRNILKEALLLLPADLRPDGENSVIKAAATTAAAVLRGPHLRLLARRGALRCGARRDGDLGDPG